VLDNGAASSGFEKQQLKLCIKLFIILISIDYIIILLLFSYIIILLCIICVEKLLIIE